MTHLTKQHSTSLPQFSNNFSWFRWGVVANAMISIIVLVLVNDYKRPWNAVYTVQCIDKWIEWNQHWAGIWFDAMFLFVVWLLSLSVADCPIFASFFHMLLEFTYSCYSLTTVVWGKPYLRDRIPHFSGPSSHSRVKQF